MKKSFLVTSVALAALPFSFAAQAAGPARVGHGTPAADAFGSSQHTLWKQMGTPSGTAFLSQNFESSFEQYDQVAADDFKVPKGHRWAIDEVDVSGVYFDGSGPAKSEHVAFYNDANGLPGAVIAEYDVAGADNIGSFSIQIPKTMIRQGVHWVSVAANMDFEAGGEWGWANQTTVRLNPAVWENPGGNQCQTWCVQGGPGDEMFMLKGNQR